MSLISSPYGSRTYQVGKLREYQLRFNQYRQTHPKSHTPKNVRKIKYLSHVTENFGYMRSILKLATSFLGPINLFLMPLQRLEPGF